MDAKRSHSLTHGFHESFRLCVKDVQWPTRDRQQTRKTKKQTAHHTSIIVPSQLTHTHTHTHTHRVEVQLYCTLTIGVTSSPSTTTHGGSCAARACCSFSQSMGRLKNSWIGRDASRNFSSAGSRVPICVSSCNLSTCFCWMVASNFTCWPARLHGERKEKRG